jgi:hypothetical protein
MSSLYFFSELYFDSSELYFDSISSIEIHKGASIFDNKSSSRKVFISLHINFLVCLDKLFHIDFKYSTQSETQYV